MPASRSAVEMPRNIAALLPKARRKPVALSQNGKTAAFLVSAREYEKLEKAANDSELSRELKLQKDIAKATAFVDKHYPVQKPQTRAANTRRAAAFARQMRKLNPDAVAKAEDEYWFERAEKAMAENPVSAEESRKFLDGMRKRLNENRRTRANGGA